MSKFRDYLLMEEDKNLTSPNPDLSEMNKKATSGIIISMVVIVILVAAGILLATSRKSETQFQGSSLNNNSNDNFNSSTLNSNASDQSLDKIKNSPEIMVEGGMYYYKPNRIEAKVGEPITVVFSNVDGMHDFVIDELNVRTEVIKTGEKETVTFTPTKAGEYEFYCSVGDHRQMGMVGTLVVTE